MRSPQAILSALAGGPEALFVVDAASVVCWVSARAASLLGRSPDAIVGSPLVELLAALTPDQLAPAWRGERVEVPVKFARDGATVQLNARVQGTTGDGGAACLVVTLVGCVSARSAADGASSPGSDVFGALWAHAPLSMARYGRDGVLIDVNKVMRDLLGLAPEVVSQLKGTFSAYDFATALGDDARMALTRAVIEDGAVVRFPVVYVDPKFVEQITGEPSLPRWFATTAFPLWRDDGTYEEVLTVDFDLTEQVRLESNLLETQKLEAVGQLAAGVAHEFNNLLTVLLGHLSFIEADLPPGGPLGESLGYAMHAADQAGALTRKLLSFALRSPPQLVEVDPFKLAEDTIALVRRAVDQQISLSLEVGPEVARHRLLADSGQLQQMLINLLLNASDGVTEAAVASPAIVLHVGVVELAAPELRAPTARRWMRFAVEDNGIGIPSAVAERVFEPFFTTKQHGHGTGLGLSVAYGNARRHGGFARVERRDGPGALVSVFLPCDEVAQPVVAPLANASPAPTGPLVLVVDDELDILEIYRDGLTLHGYQVLSANAAASAEQLLLTHANQVRALIVDLSMPRRSGRDLLRRVRPLDMGLKVIVVSGRYAPGDMGLLRELGAVALLQKPVSVDELIRTLANVLAGQPGIT